VSRPLRPPIGRQLASTAKTVSRAFDDALAAVGGSVPVWLVLISLKSQRLRNQRELAAAVGVREATLTHHLNSMDEQGLITRRRDPANRRVHLVEMTDAGEAAFYRLRDAAMDFDQRLRAGLSDDDTNRLADLLGRLETNVTGTTSLPGSPAATVPG
jgi:MarR family transcriptional regulator for hemolysin